MINGPHQIEPPTCPLLLQYLARVFVREAEKAADPEKALDALQFAIGLNLVAEKMTRRAIAKEGK